MTMRPEATAVDRTDAVQSHLEQHFRAPSQQVEKVPGVMPNQEASMAKLSGDRFYGILDLLQGYRQCPREHDAHKIFTSPRQVDCTHRLVSRKEF